MRECQRLHEKPPAARLLIRVTSYPSEHKRIDLRRIPDSCPFAYAELAAPTRHPPTRHNKGRALYCWKQRAQGDETCKPARHRRSLFLPPRPWWEVPSIFTLPRDGPRSGRLTPSAGSNQSVTRKHVQVRAALGELAMSPKKPSFPRRLPGPIRASGQIVARLDRSAALHGRASNSELPIFWPPAQPNAIL
jgi:hypothetical protein